MGWFSSLSLLLLFGCAVTASTCPIGTKAVSALSPGGRAQWCSTTDTGLVELPSPGRTYQEAVGLDHPIALPGGIDGPFTSWYPSGAMKAHGSYVNFGERSVPDGLWAFWYPDGRRQTMGLYHRGVATGCFAAWDPDGTRSTGLVDGDQLHVQPCTPPPDDELQSLEGHGRPPEETGIWADLSLQGFIGPNHIGASNMDQVDASPGMTLAFSASARKRLGHLRIGPTFGVRVGDDKGYFGVAGGAAIAWELPSIHPRIDTEIEAELGVQHTSVKAFRNQQPGTASFGFWSPLPAVQLGFALKLTPDIEALFAARVDGVPVRNVDHDTIYCDLGCFPSIKESWQVGGVAYGLNLGLRVVLH